jgi:hypothetical protein
VVFHLATSISLFKHIAEFQQQVEITFSGIFLLHEGSLPVHFAAADNQPDFGRRVDGQRGRWRVTFVERAGSIFDMQVIGIWFFTADIILNIRRSGFRLLQHRKRPSCRQ